MKCSPAGRQVKEGKNAVKCTKLSCHDFVDNQVRLQRFALAYNLGHFSRRLALPPSVKHCSLPALREKPIKTFLPARTPARGRHVREIRHLPLFHSQPSSKTNKSCQTAYK